MKHPARSVLKSLDTLNRLGLETAEASVYVVNQRLGMTGQAGLSEMGVMGPEKVEAAAASAVAGCLSAFDVAATAADLAKRQIDLAVDKLGKASDIHDAGAWLGEAMGQSVMDGLTIWNQMLTGQVAMLRPIHSRATENARRLGTKT